MDVMDILRKVYARETDEGVIFVKSSAFITFKPITFLTIDQTDQLSSSVVHARRKNQN
jgi:hypothetical protein